MEKYRFLPMSLEDDQLIICEPFGGKISENLPKNIVSFESRYISITMNSIKEKEEFIDNIALSIRKIQSDMINSFLNKKTINYL